eukprot:gene449-1090_t
MVQTRERLVLKTANQLGMAEDELSLIISAIYFNQVDAVRELLNAGVHGSVESVDSDGLTPLHHAVRYGQSQCVELLLQMDADADVISSSDDNCRTPLHHAAWIQNLECLKLLVEYGANIDLCNLHGETVMDIIAMRNWTVGHNYMLQAIDLVDFVEKGDFHMAKQIIASIENKADVINMYCRGPNTLLFKASYHGYTDIVKLLLDNGANGRENADNGMTPLYAACYAGYLDIVKLLANRLPHLLVKQTANDRSVPMHIAVLQGQLDIVKYLLELRPKITKEEQKALSDSANASAVNAGAPVARATGACGTNGNAAMEERHTRAHSVPTRNNSRKGSIKGKGRRSGTEGPIRSPGAPSQTPDTSFTNVNIRNIHGYTPLHFAVTSDRKEIALELLKCKPIMKGYVENPHPACLAVDLKTNEEKTALDYAIMLDNYEMAEILLENNADPNHNALHATTLSPLQISCRDKKTRMVRLLLKHKANVNQMRHLEDNGLSPLNIACCNDSEEIVKILLEHGAKDTNEFSRKCAAKNGLNNIVQLLLSNGVYIESEYKLPEIDPCLNPVIINWSKRKLEQLKDPWILDSIASKNLETNACAILTENPRLTRGLITRLDLSFNQLSTLPVLVFQLPSLRKLNLSDNAITVLPSPEPKGDDKDGDQSLTWNCPALEELELQKNQLTSLPKCLFDLPKLRNLYLAKNRITDVPFSMWKMPCLRELLLQGNELSGLPLKPKLARGTSQFNSMPDTRDRRDDPTGLKSTPNTAFEESDNVKSKRPSWDGESDDSDDEDEVKDVSGLQKLDISDNKVRNLPVQLPCLAPNLSKFIAAGCEISNAVYISMLPARLTILDLSRNNVRKVDLSGREPTETQCSCGSMGNARVLVQSAPGVMQRVRSSRKLCGHRSHRTLSLLTNLNLSQNKLEEIRFTTDQSDGTSTCVLSAIHTFNISHNQFKIVPPNIEKMKKLAHFEIIGNTKIDTLPPELGLCSKLYELKFNPQQFRYPPRDIIDKKRDNGQIDIPYIRKFLKRVCELARPYPTLKLMFVGLSGKGKTTLLQQLRKEGTGSYTDRGYQQRFTERMKNERAAPKPNHNESTVGVDICDWSYKKRQSKEIKFSTWDFAGQQEYYATHTCFLSKRAIYILVWKLTDGFVGIDQLEAWLLNIQARAADAAVIIVGTHYDELPTLDRREKLEQYRNEIKRRYMSERLGGGVFKLHEKGLPRVLRVAEVSCKTSKEYNINDLRNTIYETASLLKDTRNDSLFEAIVPASYIEAERAVTSIAKRMKAEEKYLVLDSRQFRMEVRAEFKKNGVRELKNDELDDAVQFLHECGVMLHFDDPSLANQYFIDPQWLCDMLANVVTVRDVNPFNKNGIIEVEKLRTQIFKGKRFSSAHVENYIELMNKFEVAIKVAEKFLLVPSFLPERQVGYQKVSSKMNPGLQQAMNVDTYLKHEVYRRQYLMAYVPRGFWARLITRLIADDRISSIVSSCTDVRGLENEVAEKQKKVKASLKCTAPPEWCCWKTGVELSCFDVKIMRVCQLEQGELFYGQNRKRKDKLFIKNGVYNTAETRGIEILVPSVRLIIDLDNNASTQAFRLVSVENDRPHTACELLTLTVEHIDNLLFDWFSTFESYQNIHGDKSIRRIGLCPDCLRERIRGGDQHRASRGSCSNIPNGEDANASESANARESANANESANASESTNASESANASESTDARESDQIDKQLKELAQTCINGFDFEEALKCVDDDKPLVCYSHGEIDFKKVFLDVRCTDVKNADVLEMFEDLPESFLFTNEQVKRTKFIAAGSYGAVFKGTLTIGSGEDATRTVAIKVPQNTDACGTENSEAIKNVIKNRNWKKGCPTMFATGIYKTMRQELAILIPVSHKHVLDILGIALSPLCLVLEFAPKGGLKDILSQYKKAGRKLDSYTIQQCILQVSDPLQYLHSCNIIYRDLKSENVLVWSFPEPGSTTRSGRPDVYLKLADYGISRPNTITGLRGHLGTSGFMAPEIIRYKGEETYSKKVDSFSFGSFMYELVTLNLPSHEVGEAIDQLIIDIGRPKISSRDRRIPLPILSLLYKCWEHDPAERPSQSDIYASAKLKEFPRLLDNLECDNAFKLRVAVTTSRRGSSQIEDCADSRGLVGSEVWLCNNEDHQDDDDEEIMRARPIGKISVLNYSDGKCRTLKKIKLVDTVLVACVVGSAVWIGTGKGAILVYCAMTYKPLALAYPSGTRSILSILHSLACHCVVIGSIDGSVMSYHDNLSNYTYNVPDADVVKYFGSGVSYNEPVKEMIHNRVFMDSMTTNPIVCLAAVPSRANHSRMEDTMKFFGSGGQPIASTSRSRVDYASDDSNKSDVGPFPVRYELWCGLQRGLITILDLEDPELQKVHLMSAKEGDINNPAIKQLSVSFMETRRVFRSNYHPPCPADGVSSSENEAASVWIVLYPGTCVSRWNVDKRKIVANFDVSQVKPDNNLNSFKSAAKQTAVQVSNAQIKTLVVVEDYMYLGTTFGCMIVCDSMSMTPLSNIRCFSDALDYLVPMQMTLNRGNTGQLKEQLILASGHNCFDKWNKDKRKKTRRSGNHPSILTWYADQWQT